MNIIVQRVLDVLKEEKLSKEVLNIAEKALSEDRILEDLAEEKEKVYKAVDELYIIEDVKDCIEYNFESFINKVTLSDLEEMADEFNRRYECDLDKDDLLYDVVSEYLEELDDEEE